MATKIGEETAAAVVRAVRALELAKLAEHEANARRVAAEQEVVRLCGFALPEGQQTFEAVDGSAGACEFTCKQPINASVDSELWRKILRRLPAKHPAREVMQTKYELRTRAARELQESDPRAWATVSECVTRKPGKVAVEVKWTGEQPKKERS